jgi:hypothetical protein
VIIAKRFCGPPDSGNSGYSAGLFASALGGGASGAVEVTLRRPPPLERELAVRVNGERAELHDGELLVAEARLTALEVTVPEPLGFERATALSKHYIGYQKHHFPGCFVCGPARAIGDGLRIFPGHERKEEPMAAPWVPDVSVADERGLVPPEQSWAALDCIGYFASGAPDYPVALLGRMTAELIGEVCAGERCVVQGTLLKREGRKLHAGTALYGETGALRGRALQTWILLA